MTWPTTLPVALIKRRYDLDPRNVQTLMESGRVRTRRTYDIPVKMIDVTWNFTLDQFNEFRSFFNDDLENGTLTFDWEEEGSLAFFPPSYEVTGTDGVYSVRAKLEVTAPYDSVPELPDITVIYEDELDSNGLPIVDGNCRSYFSLQWDYVGRDDPGIIQTALSSDGPWFDYITPVPTLEQAATHRMKVDINNQFNATRYFRVWYSGLPVTKTVNPLASVVPLPDYAITELTDGRPLPVIDAASGIFVPYSYLENGLISSTAIYVEPLARLEWNSATTAGTQILSVTNVPETGTYKWAVNGADPTIDTRNPRYNGIDNNLACGREDFAMVLRIRCFDGSCKSPVALIAIDKRHELRPIIIPVASNGPGTFVAGVCDLPKDGVLSGYDCDAVFGGVGALNDLTMLTACGNGDPALSSGGDILYYSTETSTRGPDSFGFLSHHVLATRFRADSIQPLARYSSRWDPVPLVCEYLEQATNVSVESSFELLATPILGGGLAGAGGSFAMAESVSANYIYSIVSGYVCNDSAFHHITYSQWDYLFSIINEEGDLPLAMPPPDPLVDDTVYGDDFEEYSDTDDVATISMASGSGWEVAWTINSAPVVEGFDYFEGDGIAEHDYADGAGWSTDWTVTSGSDYYDDFEDYVDASVAPANENMHGGSGWALNDDGYQHGWILTPSTTGSDYFQTYTDTSYANGVTLSDGDGWTFGSWTLRDFDYKDDFQSYADSSNVTTADAMNGGTGWDASSQWSLNSQNYLDNFESYSDDADVTTADAMNGGTGWDTAWTIN